MSDGAPRCPFLETNPPACDQSYADGLGSSFDNFQIAFAAMSLFVSVPSFYYTAKLVRAKGWTRKIAGDSQRKIFYMCSFICATLLIRSIDPEGWRGWLPIVLVGLCIDLATAGVFSLVINLVDDWTQLTLRVTNRKHRLQCASRLFVVLHVYIWTILLVTSVMQNTQDDIWRWRAIKLVLGAVMLLVLSVTLAVVGILIWRFLRRNERKLGSRQNSGVALKTPEPTAEAGSGQLRGSVGMRSQRGTAAPNNASSKRKRSKVNRILKLLVPMLILAVLTILLQLSVAQTLVDEKFTRDAPDEPPSGTGDILAEVSFEIVQVIATLVAVYFFRPRRHRSPESETSNNSQSARSSRTSSVYANRPPAQRDSQATLTSESQPSAEQV